MPLTTHESVANFNIKDLSNHSDLSPLNNNASLSFTISIQQAAHCSYTTYLSITESLVKLQSFKSTLKTTVLNDRPMVNPDNYQYIHCACNSVLMTKQWNLNEQDNCHSEFLIFHIWLWNLYTMVKASNMTQPMYRKSQRPNNIAHSPFKGSNHANLYSRPNSFLEHMP